MVKAEREIQGSNMEPLSGNDMFVSEQNSRIVIEDTREDIKDSVKAEFVRRSIYFQETLCEFAGSDQNILSLQEDIVEIERSLDAIRQQTIVTVSVLETQIAELKSRRNFLQARENSARTRFEADTRGGLFRRLKTSAYYSLCDLRLSSIAERILYPVVTSQMHRIKTNNNLADLEKQKYSEEMNFFERSSNLKEKKSITEGKMRGRIESWVLEDRERVIMYAVENPAGIKDLFYRYCENTDDSYSALQGLISEYSMLTGVKLNCFGDLSLPSAKKSVTEKRKKSGIHNQKKAMLSGENNGANGTTAVLVKEDEAQEKPCKFGNVFTIIKSDGQFERRVSEMDEDQLKKYIVNCLGNSSIEDVCDVLKMLEVIRKNPVDPSCTKNLNCDDKIRIGHQKVFLRRFNPADVIGLKMNNNSFKDWRIVYGIYKKKEGDSKIIIIDGIMEHSDFNRKYGRTRRR